MASDRREPTEHRPAAGDVRGGATAIPWISATLLVFAAALALGGWSYRPAKSPPARVPAWATDTAPVRRPRLQPMLATGVYTYRCSDCHRIIPSPSETDRTLTQHREIDLRHGLNTRCFNCHHRENRDAFVDDYGNEIPWNQPQLLCAKCHGTVYRDWQHGAHGRTNGFWDQRLGEQRRLRCIECHDPHWPPFAPMVPAPGPTSPGSGVEATGGHGGREPVPSPTPLRPARERQREVNRPDPRGGGQP